MTWVELSDTGLAALRAALDTAWAGMPDGEQREQLTDLRTTLAPPPELIEMTGYRPGDNPPPDPADGGVIDPADYDEPSKGLRCPHCGAVTWDGDEEGVRVIDVGCRWHSFGYDGEDIVGSYDNDGDYETNAYACEHCGGLVDLPATVSEQGY